VGDEAFQRKCLKRIKEFQREGRTILLVTHAVDMVRRICDRAAVLDHGELVAVGPPNDAALAFREHLRQKGAEVPPDLNSPTLLRNLEVTITDARIVYPDPARMHLFPSEPVEVHVDYDAPEPVDDVVFSIAIYDQDGEMLRGTNSDVTGDDPRSVHGPGTCRFVFERFPVMDGVYNVAVGIHSHDVGTIYDQREQKDTIEVLSKGRDVGLVHFPVHARFEARTPSASR